MTENLKLNEKIKVDLIINSQNYFDEKNFKKRTTINSSLKNFR